MVGSLLSVLALKGGKEERVRAVFFVGGPGLDRLRCASIKKMIRVVVRE